MTTINESIVEEAALAWLKSLSWQVLYEPDIAPDTPKAERTDYDQVVLQSPLLCPLRANSGLSPLLKTRPAPPLPPHP